MDNSTNAQTIYPPAYEHLPENRPPQPTIITHCQIPHVKPEGTVEEKAALIENTDGPYTMPEHIQVDFTDVFDDPNVYKKMSRMTCIDGIRKVNKGVFNIVQGAMYYFLVTLFGIFLGIAWGIVFGAVNFAIVWALQPAVKLAHSLLRVLILSLRVGIRGVLDPVFESMGQMFKFITGTFTLDVSGLPKPAAAIQNV